MHRVILSVVAALSVFGMPEMPAAADDISTCASKAGDDAVAACSRLIARNPKSPVAYKNRGVAYSGKGDYDRAIADYDLVVRLAPTEAAAYYDRGSVYGRKGDYDRAISDFDRAVKRSGSIQNIPRPTLPAAKPTKPRTIPTMRPLTSTRR
jgi:tetratricopeptide (TPR) repeat protein